MTFRRRLVPLVATALAAAVVGAACSGGGKEKAQEHKREKNASTTTTTEPPPAPPAPLTGLPMPGGVPLRPVLAVKIENTPIARPQSGLDVADVVYEEVVEGKITRFLAMFQSTTTEAVGPIRSVRATDPNIVWPVGGIFAYSGGVDFNVRLIREAPVNAVDETAAQANDSMYRDRGREAPHNLYGVPDKLWELGGQPAPPPSLFQYLGEGETFAGEPVAAVVVPFESGYAPTYTYDAPTKSWKRSYGFDPFVAASGRQIAPANVVIQFVDYAGGAGNEGAEGVTVGEGDVWVFADGQLVRGRWVRPDRAQPAAFVDGGGRPIKLVPGSTWVHLVPIGAIPEVIAPPPPPPTEPSTAPSTTRKKAESSSNG